MEGGLVVQVVTCASFALVAVSAIGGRKIEVCSGRQAGEIQRGGGEAVKESEMIHGGDKGCGDKAV